MTSHASLSVQALQGRQSVVKIGGGQTRWGSVGKSPRS